MIDRDVFTRHVRDALANMYDPVHLQTHPLADVLGLHAEAGKTVATALRERLWQAIDALQPGPAGSRPECGAALSYRLLWLYYVQARSQEETCAELGLSQRTFYRRQREAVEAVAAVLWDRCVACGEVGADDHRTPEQRQAREEAVRLASRASWQFVDIASLLNEAHRILASLAKEQGVRLNLDVPAGMPGALGDPAMFHQLLLNLLVEALRLVGGEVLTLAARPREGETLWTLRWIDATRAPDGDPLRAAGISLSQGLIEVYGGRMWFEMDGPTRVAICFTLPASTPRTVVLVDDDGDTLELYRRYLQAGGYAVQTARDRASLDQLLAQTTPDVVVLDVLMPREDGWRILQRLKTVPDTVRLPVIVCSVLSQPELALSLGACEVLQKPISEGALLEAVARALPAEDNAAAGARAAPAGT